MSKLSNYILGQALSLTNSNNVKLDNVEDLKTKLRFTFSSPSNTVTVTANDMYLSTLSRNVESNLMGTRHKFIQSICSEIKAGVREKFDFNENFIDFHQPVSPEVEQKANDLANAIIKDSLFPGNANLEYIRSLGSPILAFHTMKRLLLLMSEKNVHIPLEFLSALENPDDYFNPKKVDMEMNEEETETEGLI